MKNAPKAALVIVCILALTVVTCRKTTTEKKAEPEAVASGINITLPAQGTAPTFPADIPGGAPNASLTQAAVFAWQEFIAATWPAQPNGSGSFNRDTADPGGLYGETAASASGPPLVWETYRHKVEIFPGTTSTAYTNNTPPHGATPTNGPSYGYNTPPLATGYEYSPGVVSGACAGTTPAAATPWVNADENSQIFLDMMYAGVLGADAPQQILFLAKANQVQYQYVLNPASIGQTELANALWNHSFAGTSEPGENATDNPYYNQAVNNFLAYQKIVNSGGSGSLQSPYISFPAGTIEVKSAWRPLTSTEASSGRFHIATVRHYEQPNPSPSLQGTCTKANPCCFVDEPFGLLALHIIQKTPSAPYFIYATFSQADNILTADGKPVEDPEGRMIRQNPGPNLDTGLSGQGLNPVQATLATQTSQEQYNVATYVPPVPPPANPGPQANCTSGDRLYLINSSGSPTPSGTICVNQRTHAIPDEIISVNQAAHDAITAYNKQYNNGQTTPWNFYKLVNVQYKPMTKTPGVLYTGADAATFYQSNDVVETNYNLQFFSGRLVVETPSFGTLMSDYQAAPNNNQPFNNTFYLQTPNGSQVQAYNMGGCMGCHGNAQQAGDDFSFILNVGRNDAPDARVPNQTAPSAQAKVAKFGLPKG